jgi:nucleotide-binding universal stress UspA family protein
MFRKVVVPLDGSVTSSRGLDVAIKLCKDQKATLCLLHVVDDLIITRGLDDTTYARAAHFQEFRDGLCKEGNKLLAKAEAKVRAKGIASESILLETLGGSVGNVIIEQARKHHADLIVLGTHGRRGLARLVMGSDAETVVRSAPMPVLLVRSPSEPQSRSAKPTRK